MFAKPWEPSHAKEIRSMRRRLEENASGNNLKRGVGGTMDVEFMVQMQQLSHGQAHPEVLVPNTLDALQSLRNANILSAADADYWSRSYRFLRNIEARLRLMNTAARHDFPSDEGELRKLAFLLGQPSPEALEEAFRATLAENRRRFDQVFH